MIGVMVPSVFADNTEVTIVTVDDSGFSPACADTGCYVPLVATVDVGGVVTMTNSDPTGVHTFTSGTVDGFTPSPDGTFDTSVLMSGDYFEWIPETAGEQPYYCMLHPWMVGTIIVQEADAEEHADDHDDVEKVPTSSQISGIINLEKNTFFLSKYSTTMTTISGIIDSDSKDNVELNILKNNEITVQQKVKLTSSGKFNLPIIFDEKFTPGTYTVQGIFQNNVFDEVNFEILDGSSKNEEYAVVDKSENTVKDTSKNIVPSSEITESVSDVKPISYKDELFEITIKKISTEKLENSNLITFNLNIKNISSEEQILFGGYFFLLDSQSNEYSSSIWSELDTSEYLFQCSMVYEKINPKLSSDLEICFEVPKNNFEANALLIADNPHNPRIDRTFVIPLTENLEVVNQFGVKMELAEEKIQENKEQFREAIEAQKNTAEGGCLIATATYGSELAPQVQQLRELRDNQLLQTESGAAFMGTFNDIYYSFSPTIADMEREHPMFKEAVKLAITPMISTLSLMENANSESEVLGIGISVIMLNLGMYLGVPAIVIVGIRKKF